MKIGFFGDSYCACKGADGRISWPDTAASILDAKGEKLCKGGTHIHSALEKLRKYIDKIDYAVIVVSHPYRLPTDKGTPITPAGFDKKLAIDHYGEKITDKLEETVETYYKIFSSEFHELGQRSILQEIDNIFKEHNKPGFVIPAFPESLCGYEFNYVDWTDWDLKTFRETDRLLNFGFEISHIQKNGTFANHFSPQANLILGYVIADIISNYNVPKYIDMKVQLAKSAGKSRKPIEELDADFQKKYKTLLKNDPAKFKVI